MKSTRRHLFGVGFLLPLASRLPAARRDFWDTGEPAHWTPDQKQTILRQSPWARQGTVQFDIEGQRRGRPPSDIAVPRPGGDVPGARPASAPGAPASVPIGEPVPKAPSAEKSRPVQFPVLARWESARPVRLAGGAALPDETAGFYVIRLEGMPLLPPRKSADGQPQPGTNQEMLDAIKRGSRIERKDRPAIPCSHLLTGSGDSANNLLLFFARGADPIAVSEKFVTLVSRFGPFSLSLRFPLKEMMFRGELAL